MPLEMIFEAIYFTLPGCKVTSVKRHLAFALIVLSAFPSICTTVYVNALLATLNARPYLRDQDAKVAILPLGGVVTTVVRTVEISEPDSFRRLKDSRLDSMVRACHSLLENSSLEHSDTSHLKVITSRWSLNPYWTFKQQQQPRREEA